MLIAGNVSAVSTADMMFGDNAARALVNETEEEEMEFRDRFVDVIRAGQLL